jgi:hypothetical protein
VRSLSIVGGAYYTLLPETQRTLRGFKASACHIAVDF